MSQIQSAAASGLTPNVDAARRARGQLLDGEGNVLFKDYPRYSIQAVPTAGQTSYTFFQDAGNQGEHVTNIPQPGQLITNGIYRAHAMVFDFWFTGDDEFAIADAGAFALAQAHMRLLKGGAIKIWRGERVEFSDYLVASFPAGGGPVASLAVATTASTTSMAGAAINNGIAAVSNVRRFLAPIDITLRDNVKVEVVYPAAIALPSGVTGKFMCKLIGDVLKETAAG